MIKSFKVFSQNVKVHYHKKQIFDDSGRQIYGYYDLDKKEIHIAHHKNKEEMLHTVMHEAIHALQHRLGLRQWMSHDQMETMAETFATFIIENFNAKK